LDGLDWEILDRLSRDGAMPNWKRLASEGYRAKLDAFMPLLSPILWTTAATGVGPEVHRVLDFQEVDPATGRKVPISGWSRQVPAVWNFASAQGRRVGVVGWWATHPAEDLSGFFISDRVSPLLFKTDSVAGATYPVALAQTVSQVLRRDGHVEDKELNRFLAMSPAQISAARSTGMEGQNRVTALARILAATRVTQRLARELYDRDRPDLLAAYFEGTDEIGHLFAPYAPPKLDCVSEEDVAQYGRTVDAYYALIDKILGQWLRRAQEDRATLLIHSDHGFKWGSDRPCRLASKDWATAAFWHRPEGVLLAWGPRVKPSAAFARASLFDVAPTVLGLLGLPVDRAMTGRPVREICPDLESGTAKTAPQPVVRRVADRPVSTEEADEYAKKLMALGYLSRAEGAPLAAPGGTAPGLTEGAWNNLGVYWRDTRHAPAAARAAFKKSLALRSDYYSPMYNLAVLARSERNTKEAEDWLFRALAALGQPPDEALLGWSHEYQKAGKISAARSLLERAAAVYPKSEEIARDLARLRVRLKDCASALAGLAPFESTSSDPRTFNTLALIQTCRGDRSEVARLLQRSLDLKPDQPEVARLLSVARGETPQQK
jgi:predicted AlkP superfamily phosphohydrolase/phosphomutase/Flp pilus assembly protein TadD